ncbi:hypothetical protein GCM10009801_49410 [Streptomyces albiaxialis]|uniref:GAF domain-containing protein n=1 Tax=Streptomyces albiaxialis TaxID=329523 RepID=A0ABN2W8Y7_9ACTN
MNGNDNGNDGGSGAGPAVPGPTESESEDRRLLQSVVETARAIFDARASSIFLLDEERGELVFEAVSGEGEDQLVGRRFPAARGLAGWVIQSRQPLEVDDVDEDARFARDLAQSTRYVPRALMAAPLLHGEEVLGALEVLDRSKELRTELAAMDLLALFSGQAAAALSVVRRRRRRRTAEPYDGAAGLVEALSELRGERRRAGVRLVGALEELLRP